MVNIGLDEPARLAIAEDLKKLLAGSYTLYVQTHNFHWNVTGPMFRELHLMFEEQYTELATAVDEIAERIRALGAFAPGTYAAFTQYSPIQQVEGNPSAEEMVNILTQNHEQLVRASRGYLAIAQENADESTAALISDRMRVHEKTAWMLRATRSTQ